MTTKAVPGQLVASSDAAEVAEETALRLARALRLAITRGGRATIALSGGNTPRDAYARLARESGVDWTKIDIFWVDERAVAPTDDRSNYRWAKATLLDGSGIAPERVHRMPAEAPDLEAAARDYEGLLRKRIALDGDGIPALDIVVLGVGDDGHTASLFPGGTTPSTSSSWPSGPPSGTRSSESGRRRATSTTPLPVWCGAVAAR
jgi:6-phosphogluconolactonase